MDNLATEKEPKSSRHFYICNLCDYKTSKYSNFTKHLLTLKHKRITMDNKSSQKVAKSSPNDNMVLKCECGKTYKYKSGLCKHKKVCNYGSIKKNVEHVSVENDYEHVDKDELIMQLFKKMDEKDKQISELIPKIGNTTNNNNQFNLNLFLKEDCKDAINWTEFVNSIELEINALDCLKDSNITIGITNAICNKMNELGVYKRPIHCVDQKRRKLCIKNDEDWEKNDNKVDELITKSDKQLQHKYIELMYELEKNNPSWIGSEEGMEEYMKLQNKIYENIDSEKFKAMLVKGSVIPKELRDD